MIGSIVLLIFPGIRHYPLAWLAMHLGPFAIFLVLNIINVSPLDWLIWLGLIVLWALCICSYLLKPTKLTTFALGLGVFLWFFLGVFFVGQFI